MRYIGFITQEMAFKEQWITRWVVVRRLFLKRFRTMIKRRRKTAAGNEKRRKGKGRKGSYRRGTQDLESNEPLVSICGSVSDLLMAVGGSG